ncbi:MAG TPA: integrase core domain-containing protein [Tepidisphaeraceae bacterium]|nr:integrase core domain-containing protein [Tepidisphaeraceae bacterium]
MKRSAHPERQSAFEQRARQLGLLHGTSQPGCPWQNGIVERSHRTDNEELFQREQFSDSEQRRYRLRLWEDAYNHRRPHQALHGQTPQQVFLAEYPLYAVSRMLT